MDLNDAEGLAAMEHAIPVMGEEEITPHLQEFRTVGHLYRSIEAGFRHPGKPAVDTNNEAELPVVAVRLTSPDG